MGLFVQVNKNDGNPAAAALNLYPKNKTFTGNYALRFDMYQIVSSGAVTEYALCGINHSATKTNWFRNNAGGVPAGWTFDGLFYGVEADGAGNGDYVLYSAPTTTGNNPTALSSRAASTLTGIFKAPPFAYAGAPANVSSSGTPSWADVEISQVGNLITLKINNTLIFAHTNATAFASGNLMLGHCDAYDSVGANDGGVIFDNVRVVQLPASSRPNITGIQVGTEVRIAFTAETSDSASAFGVQASGTVNGVFGDVTATINPGSTAGSFTAVCSLNGAQQFYRIVRK